MALMKATGLLSAATLVVMAAVKERPASRHPFVLNRTYHVVSAVLAGILLAGHTGMLLRSVVRFGCALRSRRCWSRRRKWALVSTYTRAVALLVALLTWLLTAAWRAANAESFCEPAAAIVALECVHWTAWNVLLLVTCTDAHNIVLRPQPGRPDGQVRDASLWIHLPKALLWAANEGAQPACCKLLT